jgi:predicted P-loop ATPase
MSHLPEPNQPPNIASELENETLIDRFPHFKLNNKGEKYLLNTGPNLSVLLDYTGIKAAINKMTYEPELSVKGKAFPSVEAARSCLITNAAIIALPKVAIDDHLVALAEKNSYHPIAELLNAGQWDGNERVELVLACLNAKDPELAIAIMKKWLVGCVASLYEKTFSSKLVPVLQGDQSYMKTAFISRIANIIEGAFLEGAELNPDNKDSVLSCIKSWVVELGELERTSKNSQGSLKAFITKPIDTIRPPYARGDIKKPRQTHFIASVNGVNFLKDETGNSRYGVIELAGAVDIDATNSLLGYEYKNGSLKLVHPELLLQFWLEIKAMYDANYGWTLSKNELRLAAKVADKYSDKGNWYEMLSDHIARAKGAEAKMTATEICNYLGVNTAQIKWVGKALTQLVKEGLIKKGRTGQGRYYLFPTCCSEGCPSCK